MAEASSSHDNAVVAEMAAVLAEVTDEATAASAAAALGAHFAGCQIYFPVRATTRAARIESMLAAGADHNEICRKLRISRTTLYRFLNGAK